MDHEFRSFKDLKVWQKAIDLSVACYRLTEDFPKRVDYGMTSQIRRAAVSIAANIAEGHGREQTKPFIQFLRISQGSTKELETHLIIVQRVNLASAEQLAPLTALVDEIGRMLRSLIRTLETKAET
jgi:four helix bundle protein